MITKSRFWSLIKTRLLIVQNHTVERKRFTALHELGHLVLRFSPELSDIEKESLCHAFAVAMLIPNETFIQEVGSKKRNIISIGELMNIKETYGISIQAIMARTKSLQIINENRCIRFRKYIYNDREEKNLGKYQGKEQPVRFISL